VSFLFFTYEHFISALARAESLAASRHFILASRLPKLKSAPRRLFLAFKARALNISSYLRRVSAAASLSLVNKLRAGEPTGAWPGPLAVS